MMETVCSNQYYNPYRLVSFRFGVRTKRPFELMQTKEMASLLYNPEKDKNAPNYITEKCMQTGNLLQHKLSCSVTYISFIFSDYIMKKNFFSWFII